MKVLIVNTDENTNFFKFYILPLFSFNFLVRNENDTRITFIPFLAENRNHE